MARKIKILLTILLYGILAVLIGTVVYYNGTYPSGSDTLCHIYKGDVLYRSILKGDWYPLYDGMWYNGVEMMRYWAPLPVYFLAGCQALAGGNELYGYLVFVGLIFFLGALSWLRIGVKHNRPYLGAFLGILWFFMPNNLYAMFYEGNLPRSLCMVLLPLFISQVHDYLLQNKWSSLPKMIGCFVLMILCHSGYAGMIALSVLIFGGVYLWLYRDRKKIGDILVCILLAFLITGLWLVPSLLGGITSTDSSETMKLFFQDLAVTLNPVYTLFRNEKPFYFGLAAFGLAVFGAFGSYKKCIPGFLSGIIICLCTTTTMYGVLVFLPGSQYLWMLRFISIALCMILYSFLLWDTLKKPFMWLACVLLCADTLLSLHFVYGEGDRNPVEARLEEYERETLFKEAKEVTVQRLALMDMSSMGAQAAYVLSDFNEGVPTVFGAGWQSANTAHNIVQLNQAMEDGGYLYLFDRCMELGADTVLIQNSQLDNGPIDIPEVDESADRLGYRLLDFTDNFRLYHLDVEGAFGVQSAFRAIGIGTSAPSISVGFPAVEETVSNNLDDYTYEELCEYDLLYLAGFTYTDRKKAEDLVLRLSENGTRVVILADGLPEDDRTGVQTFLGMNCYNITFHHGYPELETIDGTLICDLFPNGYSNWKTVYVNGLDEVWGSVLDAGVNLDFYGRVKNENIIVIGLNLTYDYALTKDPVVGELLSHALYLSPDELPKRNRVPVTIEETGNQIMIQTDYEDVNTCLAYHDIFRSDREIRDVNHLMHVDRGTTVIHMEYPYLAASLLVSGLGILATAVFLIVSLRREKKAAEQEEVKAQEEIREDSAKLWEYPVWVFYVLIWGSLLAVPFASNTYKAFVSSIPHTDESLLMIMFGLMVVCSLGIIFYLAGVLCKRKFYVSYGQAARTMGFVLTVAVAVAFRSNYYFSCLSEGLLRTGQGKVYAMNIGVSVLGIAFCYLGMCRLCGGLGAFLTGMLAACIPEMIQASMDYEKSVFLCFGMALFFVLCMGYKRRFHIIYAVLCGILAGAVLYLDTAGIVLCMFALFLQRKTLGDWLKSLAGTLLSGVLGYGAALLMESGITGTGILEGLWSHLSRYQAGMERLWHMSLVLEPVTLTGLAAFGLFFVISFPYRKRSNSMFAVVMALCGYCGLTFFISPVFCKEEMVILLFSIAAGAGLGQMIVTEQKAGVDMPPVKKYEEKEEILMIENLEEGEKEKITDVMEIKSEEEPEQGKTETAINDEKLSYRDRTMTLDELLKDNGEKAESFHERPSRGIVHREDDYDIRIRENDDYDLQIDDYDTRIG